MRTGGTALHVAAQEGKTNVVRLLTEAGAQLYRHTENSMLVVHLYTSLSTCDHNHIEFHCIVPCPRCS